MKGRDPNQRSRLPTISDFKSLFYATDRNPTAAAWHNSSLMRVAVTVFMKFLSLKSMRDAAATTASGEFSRFTMRGAATIVASDLWPILWTIVLDSGSSQRINLVVGNKKYWVNLIKFYEV